MNVRVFDGERPVDASAVRVDGAAVAELGGPRIAAPEDTVVDGRGATLLPGLIDAHVHLLPGTPRQALSFGVTTVLDMFSKPPLVGECLAAGETQGCAQVFTSGVGATAPGGHPSLMYAPFPHVRGPHEAEAFVRDRQQEGARYLKILYESGQDISWSMPSLDLPTVRALVEAAHEADMLVVAHAHRSADALDVITAGVDVLAHAPTDPLDEQQVEVVARSGVAVVTTLSVSDGFPAPDAPMPLLTQPRLAARLGEAWTEVLHSQARRWMPPQMPRWEIAHANVAALHAAGVPILAGTDAPNPGTVHGASLHRELQHLTEAGLEPSQALHAATGAVADVFGLSDRGRLYPGARADLLLVQGRPEDRITDTQEVTAVWKAGQEQKIDGYVGSQDETDGIEALESQVRRVVDEMSKKFPGPASSSG